MYTCFKTPKEEIPAAPRFKLLQQAIQDAGIEPFPGVVTSMRQIAKQLNSCHRIGRKFCVSDEQFARVLEAYRNRPQRRPKEDR